MCLIITPVYRFTLTSIGTVGLLAAFMGHDSLSFSGCVNYSSSRGKSRDPPTPPMSAMTANKVEDPSKCATVQRLQLLMAV